MTRPVPIKPTAGQESVWDYPRPPKVEAVTKLVQVVFQDLTIAETRRSWRVLETSHPPVYYLPPEDILLSFLVPTSKSSFCEWKGTAAYYDIVIDGITAANAAWTYPKPSPAYEQIKNHVAFYAWAMDRCLLEGETVRPQPGRFYGGWITNNIVGPFKGEPGSSGW